jgi:hypothetical protein
MGGVRNEASAVKVRQISLRKLWKVGDGRVTAVAGRSSFTKNSKVSSGIPLCQRAV